MNRWWLVAVAAGLASLALGPPVAAAAEQEAGKTFVLTGPLVFPLEEAPAFGKEEMSGRPQYRYPRGQTTTCGVQASGEVKKYPPLKSKQPLYGTVRFGGNAADPSSGTTYFFVLDESGEGEKQPEAGAAPVEPKPAAEKPQASGQAAKNKPPAVKPPGARRAAPGAMDPFASPQIKQSYDLLYFDRNGDRDLTNDGVVRLAAKPLLEMPAAGMFPGVSGEIAVSFDFGPGVGQKPFPVAVAVYAYPGAASVMFVPKMARRGKVTLGTEQYVVTLSQVTAISGRYDQPSTVLEVTRTGGPAATMLLRPALLGQVHWVGEQVASISTTPLGDKLTIEPYRGDTGTLEIGPGGRAITELGLTGTLTSRSGNTQLGATSGAYPVPTTLPRRYVLPVGDYGLPYFTAQYGRLRFSARTSSPVRPSGTTAPSTPPSAFPIHIRKDARHVLDFSGKAQVVFSNPAKDKTFRPGDRVDIRAMLTEPWQNLQITGLWDTSKKSGELKYRTDAGEVTVPQYPRLDPTIAIKDSTGKVVAEGKMPFG